MTAVLAVKLAMQLKKKYQTSQFCKTLKLSKTSKKGFFRHNLSCHKKYKKSSYAVNKKLLFIFECHQQILLKFYIFDSNKYSLPWKSSQPLLFIFCDIFRKIYWTDLEKTTKLTLNSKMTHLLDHNITVADYYILPDISISDIRSQIWNSRSRI